MSCASAVGGGRSRIIETIHEVKLIVDLIHEEGIASMNYFCLLYTLTLPTSDLV